MANVVIYQLDDDYKLKTKWDTVAEAAKAFGVSRATLARAARDGYRCRDFHWSYRDPRANVDVRRKIERMRDEKELEELLCDF